MIRDLLAEMLPSANQTTPEFRALIGQTPGGAITCPYCQRAVEYDLDGRSLVVSARVPLRYERAKMYLRSGDYVSQKSPPDQEMTPEQWVAEEKLMPGALQGYLYAEDVVP
jgi:surfactin synthase thioesterase subunit